MSGYVITQIEVTNPEDYKEYYLKKNRYYIFRDKVIKSITKMRDMSSGAGRAITLVSKDIAGSEVSLKIDGNIYCKNADIEGKLNGIIEVDELLSLKSTAKLQGEISTNKLSIEPGAIFSGNCKMGAVLKDLSNNEEKLNEPEQALQEKSA